MICSARVTRALVLPCVLGAAAQNAQADVVLSQRKSEWRGTPELMREMQRGGFVVYFRHGRTNWSEKLREQRFTTFKQFDLANCATQRNLSEEGRADARMIRFAFESMGIPTGRVYASQFCRPAEYVQIITGNNSPERVFWLTGLGRPETLPRLRERAATPPEPGTNVILGDHGDLIYNVTDWVIQEGDAVVFRPEPPSYRAIAWIRPHEWLQLAHATEAQRGPTPTTVTGYAISGDNPLTEDEGKAILAPLVGRPADVTTRYTAVAELEAALRARGHGAHVVRLADGNPDATLRVRIERVPLGELRIKRNTLSSADAIRAAVPALRSGEAPDTVAVARQLLSANENPARTINVLYAAGNRPGTIDADVEVIERRPWSAALRLDNSGTDATGRARAGLALEHANVLGFGHIARAAFVTSPSEPDDTRQWGLAYTAPIPRLGGALTGFWARSSVDAGVVDGVTPITGAGHFGGVRYRHQLAPRGDYHSDVFVSLEDRFYSGSGLAANVRGRPIAVGYAGHWEEQWIGWNFALAYAHNLASGSANDDATYARVRTHADREWGALRARADFTRILTYDLRLIVRARAQLSRDALIPGEQIGLGGALGNWSGWPWGGEASVRGFEERAVRGDSGFATNIEFWSRRQFGQDLRFGGFLDWGYVKREQPVSGVQRADAIASIGVGARYRLDSRVTMRVEFAHVLAGSDDRPRGANRVFAAVALTY